MRRLLALSLLAGSLVLPAIAQEASEADRAARETWLRYSNWERRSTAPRSVTSAKPSSGHGANSPAQAARVPLPDSPGSQTVEPGQSTNAGWVFQPTKAAERPPQLFVGGDFPGRYGYACNSAYAAGYGLAGWTDDSFYGAGRTFAGPYFGGGFPGRTFSGPYYGAGFPGRTFGGPYYGAGFPSRTFGRPYYGAGFRSGRLEAQVIETGPSPPSGNYYQPVFNDRGLSGHYYESGTPFQVPLAAPEKPKDYWGPQGSPFTPNGSN